jgi:hypothetical protein
MLLYFVLVLLCLNSVRTEEDFIHFKTLLRAKHAERMRPKIDQIGRQADPCRIAAMMGRQGQTSLFNRAEKVLMKMKNTADNVRVRKAKPERKVDACIQAMRYSKDGDLNRDICAEALAHYMKRKEDTQESVGRSGGSETAWDELYREVSESLNTDQIMESLDLWSSTSLGLLIDNTGSMADDIDQVFMF